MGRETDKTEMAPANYDRSGAHLAGSTASTGGVHKSRPVALAGECTPEELRDLISSAPLPEEFKFGVATAGFQNEGGFNGHDEPKNNWADWEIAGRAEPSGKAVMFWQQPERHIEAAASMGLNAFRMSIEWARVFPTERMAIGGPPEPDIEAVKRYARIVSDLRKAGMEPLITLHHFTHPRWLGMDAWSRDSTIERFLEYVSYTLDTLNSNLVANSEAPLRHIVTFNEPNALAPASYLIGMFPPGRRGHLRETVGALDRLLAAHIKAYNVIHDLYEVKGWDPPSVSTNIFFCWTWPLGQVVVDLLLAREAGVPPNDSDLLAYVRDSVWRFSFAASQDPMYPKGIGSLVERLLQRCWPLVAPSRLPLWMESLYGARRESCLDYISIDYYDPFIGNGLRKPGRNHGFGQEWSPVIKLWEQTFHPTGLSRAAEAACQNAPHKPLVIAENGMSSPTIDGLSYGRPDGVTRDFFIRRHLAEIYRILSAGLRVEGYYHWTLFDNYEWGSYAPRFGIFGVDRTTDPPTLLETDAMGIDAAAAYKKAIAAMRSGDPDLVVDELLKQA
jgi:beta-glucosidase